MNYLTESGEETEQLGATLAAAMKGGETVCLTGELGAGKSTFTRGFIRYFIPHARVLSPTFTIVRHYPIAQGPITQIVHADCYRLNSKNTLETIGLSEMVNNKKSLVVIEWPERLHEFKADHPVHITFRINDAGTRRIYFERTGRT